MQVLNPRQYVETIGKIWDVYSDEASVPEFNLRAMRKFLELTEKFGCKYYHQQPIYLIDGFPLYANLFGGEELDHPGNRMTCHLPVPFTSKQIIEALPNIAQGLIETDNHWPIAPFTITPLDYQHHKGHTMQMLEDPELQKYFTWLNSPLAALYDDFDWYLQSLTSKRRYKVKEALKQYRHLSSEVRRKLTDDEIQFCVDNITYRWLNHGPEEERTDDVVEYAMLQFLWSVAASEARGAMFNVHHDESGNLVCISHFVQREKTLVFQGLAYDQHQPLPNIGAFTLASLIQILCCEDGGINYIDPTCRASFVMGSIDIYKRLIVNENCLKPSYLYLYRPEQHLDYFRPPYFLEGKGWQFGESHLTTCFDGV